MQRNLDFNSPKDLKYSVNAYDQLFRNFKMILKLPEISNTFLFATSF